MTVSTPRPAEVEPPRGAPAHAAEPRDRDVPRGLWNGAARTFVAWGLYHGLLLAGHGVLRARGWVPRWRPLSVALTFVAVVVGWVMFRATMFGEAWRVLEGLAGLHGVLGDVAGLEEPREARLAPRRPADAFVAPSPFLYFQF